MYIKTILTWQGIVIYHCVYELKTEPVTFQSQYKCGINYNGASMILKFGFNYQVFTISQLLKLPYSIMIIYMVLYQHTPTHK